MMKASARFVLTSLLVLCLLPLGCARKPGATEEAPAPATQVESEAATVEEISTEDFEGGQIEDPESSEASEDDGQRESEAN